MARVLDNQSVTLGDAALTAGAVATFDMSSLTQGGNVVTVSNASGGCCRMTVNTVVGAVASDPQSSTTSAQTEEVAFYLDGGNAVYTFGSTTQITSVKIRPITTAWGLTLVTVHRDQ